MTIDRLIKTLQKLRRQAKKDVRVCMITDQGDLFCLDFRPQVAIVPHAAEGGEEPVLAIASHDIPIHDEDCGCPKLKLIKSEPPDGPEAA